MNPFRRDANPHTLVVGMTGVKLGDRLAQVGCAHGGRLAAVARQVGLSGQAVAIVPDDVSAARARKGAAQAGVLVEVEVAPPTRLPLADAGFDLVILDETDGLLAALAPDEAGATIREALRALRPGGRLMVIAAGRPEGLSALFARKRSGPAFDSSAALPANGFRSVRTLAEREGLVFVEGIKPRTA